MSFAVIGGTSLEGWGSGAVVGNAPPNRYGRPSALLRQIPGHTNAVFLNRHGARHEYLPHEINYRANLWALKELGVTHAIAVFAVGGIESGFSVGDFVVPDQLIDYTYGREMTFRLPGDRAHIDFTYPFDRDLSANLIATASRLGIDIVEGGVYAATQGPRLETAAEVTRLARDGCTLVGMTAAPEAPLAREADIAYAPLCVVVNPAAGVVDGQISHDEMGAAVERTQAPLKALLGSVIESEG